MGSSLPQILRVKIFKSFYYLRASIIIHATSSSRRTLAATTTGDSGDHTSTRRINASDMRLEFTEGPRPRTRWDGANNTRLVQSLVASFSCSLRPFHPRQFENITAKLRQVSIHPKCTHICARGHATLQETKITVTASNPIPADFDFQSNTNGIQGSL